MNLKARLNRSDPHQPSSNYDSKESLSEMFRQRYLHVHLQEMPLTIQYLLFSVCVREVESV